MKRIITRILIYIILIIIFITLGIIGYKNQPSDLIDSKILNKDFYRYNTNTGTYDKIRISEKEIHYEGDKINLNSCKRYTYTESTGIIKFDCKKELRLITLKENDDVFVINTTDENLYFYTDKEKSLQSEFQRRFTMTLDTYRIEGEEKLKTIEITGSKLQELSKLNEKSFIYIKSENCNNECSLFNKEFMNFSGKDNKYYLKSENITKEDIENLSKNYTNFPITLESFELENPVVLGLGKNYFEIIRIEGKGFDFSSYRNYAESLEVDNE